jgi:CTP-dependent riboflavin kinase
MTTWNFITNYGSVLTLVAKYPQITARQMASQIGVTERTVLRIIADLEEEGYLRRSRNGRGNYYEVDWDLPIRGSEMQDIPVGELLNVLLDWD